MTDEECVECTARAVRSGSYGEPLCLLHWREAGMYDPHQGLAPTERDYDTFRRFRRTTAGVAPRR